MISRPTYVLPREVAVGRSAFQSLLPLPDGRGPDGARSPPGRPGPGSRAAARRTAPRARFDRTAIRRHRTSSGIWSSGSPNLHYPPNCPSFGCSWRRRRLRGGRPSVTAAKATVATAKRRCAKRHDPPPTPRFNRRPPRVPGRRCTRDERYSRRAGLCNLKSDAI